MPSPRQPLATCSLLLLLVFACLGVFEDSVGLANAQTCTVPASTLSSDCGSTCSVCMLETAASCGLACFFRRSNTAARFTFLIPYDATVGDTATTPSKANDALTKIANLALPTFTTEVYGHLTELLTLGFDVLSLY